VIAALSISKWRSASGDLRNSLLAAVLIVSAGGLNQAKAASGDLDTTFGTAGTVRTDFRGNFDEAKAVVIQRDGKIVAAGSSYSGSNTVQDFIVARYNANGSRDDSFGNNGKVTTDFFGNVDSINAIVIQPDDKILVAGTAQLAGSGSTPRIFALARYNSDGSPDPTFGSAGVVTTNFGGNFASASAVMLQPDGKIVVAGSADFNPAIPNSGQDFALARYNANGSLDGTFGNGGKVVLDFFGGFDQANAAALQPDGKIIVAGSAPSTSSNQDIGFALARFNPDGRPDLDFGSGGKQITHLYDRGAQANGVVLQPDGKIVLAGTAPHSAARGTGSSDFALARYNTNGLLDSSFGTGGLTAIPFPDGATEQGNALVLSPDGKIVVAGAAFVTFSTPADFALARYNPDGSFDTTFGSGGIVRTDFAGAADIAQAIAIQSDGNVVAAGKIFRNNYDLALARYVNDVAPTATLAFSAVSRKIHGDTPRDISLPLTGSLGIECRDGGPTNDYQVLFTFANAVTFSSAAVTSGIGSVSSSSGNGTTTVTVNLTGVTNAQRITITLAGVSDGSNTTDIAVQMGVLIGDTTGNGIVNATDISQTKLQTGQTVTNANFREDVGANGSTNASDVSLVKLHSGTSLP
jgi:uncharacterized delta-60 repeat protein